MVFMSSSFAAPYLPQGFGLEEIEQGEIIQRFNFPLQKSFQIAEMNRKDEVKQIPVCRGLNKRKCTKKSYCYCPDNSETNLVYTKYIL